MATFVIEAFTVKLTAEARALQVDGKLEGPVTKVLAGERAATPPGWLEKDGGPWWLVTYVD